jgi:uncharacterized membrane protein
MVSFEMFHFSLAFSLFYGGHGYVAYSIDTVWKTPDKKIK